MKQQVLKVVSKADLQEARDIAEREYMARPEHYGSYFTGEFDKYGNVPSKFFRGPLVEFKVYGVEAVIDLVIEKQSQGWKRSDIAINNDTSNVYVVHLIKSDELIQADLKEEFKEAEAALRARVEKSNEALIANTVAQRKAQVLKEREEAARAADEALEAELEAEVRAALKGGK
ncbi:hypothetical protein [Pseudomonas sp. PLMAX]|uniref:hypothetical protein n=1 Tax=Pseudomonas sp. PLMAX TaxID=2201998 RepID=UPI0038BD13D2